MFFSYWGKKNCLQIVVYGITHCLRVANDKIYTIHLQSTPAFHLVTSMTTMFSYCHCLRCTAKQCTSQNCQKKMIQVLREIKCTHTSCTY